MLPLIPYGSLKSNKVRNSVSRRFSNRNFDFLPTIPDFLRKFHAPVRTTCSVPTSPDLLSIARNRRYSRIRVPNRGMRAQQGYAPAAGNTTRERVSSRGLQRISVQCTSIGNAPAQRAGYTPVHRPRESCNGATEALCAPVNNTRCASCKRCKNSTRWLLPISLYTQQRFTASVPALAV